ncbi:MAG: serine/threonine-protein kinase [Spirochaetaceae bacterium]
MAKIPDSIGKYKVLEQLAQGGMGAVYSATHPTLDRTVIIKKLTLRGNPSIRERFRREAQIMMDLRNDAIVDVYDHFREGSSYYIVLEYVDGPSLEGLIERERYLPERIALTILREACRALAYAHEHNVVHRDIKPANILISKRGEVKLVDFGIATIHGDEPSDLTQEGTTLGTPSYMAPEQFQSSRSVDFRADIYSLGVVLYEMVTGKRPYPGSLSPEVVARIQRGRYENPRKVNPRVSPYVTRLVRKLMHPKPKRRNHSLDRLVAKLDKRIGIRGRTGATRILRPYVSGEASVVPRRSRRSRHLVTAATLVLILIGLAGYGYLRGYHLELFQPEVYGAVEITVRIEKGRKELRELYLSGTLYETDGESYTPLEGGEIAFRPLPEREQEESMATFRSSRRQLPEGEYRLELEAENRLLYREFTVVSFSDRSRSPVVVPGRRENATQLLAEFEGNRRLPLELSFVARDALTNERIDNATLLVNVGGRWRRWTPLLGRMMRSGEEYAFRLTHPDYEREELSLWVAPDQSSLHLVLTLDPEE